MMLFGRRDFTLPYSKRSSLKDVGLHPTSTFMLPISNILVLQADWASLAMFCIESRSWSDRPVSAFSCGPTILLSTRLASVCFRSFLYGSIGGGASIWRTGEYLSFTIRYLRWTLLRAEFSLRIFLTGTLSRLIICAVADFAACFCWPMTACASNLYLSLRSSSSKCAFFLSSVSISSSIALVPSSEFLSLSFSRLISASSPAICYTRSCSSPMRFSRTSLTTILSFKSFSWISSFFFASTNSISRSFF